MTELYAILSGDPWCWHPEKIGRLTLYQVRNEIFRERDKDGRIRRDTGKAPTRDPHEEFVRRWMRWGLSRQRAELKWQEYLAENADDEGDGQNRG